MDDGNLRGEDSLAYRLNALFASTASSRGRGLSNNEVAAAIKTANPEIRVSGAYLSALRSGKRARPSMELLMALAEYFEVSILDIAGPPGSGSKAQDTSAEVSELAARLNELGVRRIALRAVGLNEDSVSTVTAVLDHVRKLQGLPAVGDYGDTETNGVASPPE